MDPIIVKEILQKYGLSGALLAWIVWTDLINPILKKYNGEWISWDSIKVNSEKISALESKLETHLGKEAEEDIRIERMHTTIHALESQVDRENNHIFSQLKSLHEKFDSLQTTLLEISIQIQKRHGN